MLWIMETTRAATLTTTTLGRLRSANASTNASGWTRERAAAWPEAA